MNASIKNILIGLFVLLAAGIIVFMLLFLHPSVGDNAKTLRVRFTDIDKVNIGTRVTYAGRPVGEVVSISEIPEARTSRLDQNGEVYVYELVLKVDSGVDVYNTDDVSLRTSGLLGERNIEIDPRPLKPGEKLQSIENNVIFASSTNSVETTLKQFEELSQKFGRVLDDVHELMQEIQKENIVQKISHSANNVVEITDTLNQPQIWKKTLDNMLAFSNHINESLTQVDQSIEQVQTITKKASTEWVTSIDQTLYSIRALAQKADEMTTLVREGKGTLGELIVGNDLFLRLKAVLSKGSTVMNDITTYGILFHLDKRWQRVHAGRLKLLQKLSTPEEFASYFTREVNAINDSLSRVSVVLNDSTCYPHSLVYDPQFISRFGDLLGRVESMEETLKMYNEQVLDQE